MSADRYVDSIGQNYRPMRQRSDSFEIALLCLTKICLKTIGSLSHRTITNIHCQFPCSHYLLHCLRPGRVGSRVKLFVCSDPML